MTTRGFLRFALIISASYTNAQVFDAGAAPGGTDHFFTPAGTCIKGGTCRTTTAAMGDPPMDTQRFGFDGTPFTYAIPEPNGIYDLILSFAESSKTAPRQRVFTVTVQGEESAPIDLVAITGGPNFPYVQTWRGVVVRAGMLTVRFNPVIGNAVINAIEVRPSSGPCDGAIVCAFADHEKPAGVQDGVNLVFTILAVPRPSSEHVFLNGVYQRPGIDYNIVGNVITFLVAAPVASDILQVDYRV